MKIILITHSTFLKRKKTENHIYYPFNLKFKQVHYIQTCPSSSKSAYKFLILYISNLFKSFLHLFLFVIERISVQGVEKYSLVDVRINWLKGMKSFQICKFNPSHVWTWKVTHFDINALQHFDYLHVSYKRKGYFYKRKMRVCCQKWVFFRLKKVH